jgi:hypothetical protein
MGGGYPNTEFRSLTERKVFNYFDFISLDDGELPIELIIKQVLHPTKEIELKRTYHLINDTVFYNNKTALLDYKQNELGTPDYSDLKLNQYISVIEIANPMHSLWSDGRWNKLTMAHGCYWGKCTFCDVSLDYIRLYEPIAANLLVNRMEEIIAQTGENGFHFVDEAAPPSLMKALAIEIIKRKVVATWWTNIRFEKNFTQDLCTLLKASGCIAVSGGLEVASDRLLALIDKGVTVSTVAQTTRNFTESGIMVHAYLMYGYPTQTVQETIDSLEMVRQLFELGVIQSGFWHQFALTAHSPIGLSPEKYQIIPNTKEISFAQNDIDFVDKTGIDHNQFSFGLKKSLYNFMHGIGFELPVQNWFEYKVPKTTISKNYIESCLEQEQTFSDKSSSKIIWLGSEPLSRIETKRKRDEVFEQLFVLVHTKEDELELKFEKEEGLWLMRLISELSPSTGGKTLGAIKTEFEQEFENFELFWYSKSLNQLKNIGLISI